MLFEIFLFHGQMRGRNPGPDQKSGDRIRSVDRAWLGKEDRAVNGVSLETG